MGGCYGEFGGVERVSDVQSSALRLRGLTKVYAGGTVALRSLDLEVRAGELLVLVGPSGCGKTTTLRLIAGLEEPTEGEVWIGEREVTAVVPRDRDVAMVFQNYALYPHMSVYDNLAFGLRMRRRQLGLSKEEIDRRVREVAARLGLEPLLGRRPRQLSGGERQRVALGRAMVRRPAVFLLDEPLSNLDAQLRLEVRRDLKKLHQDLGATMLYVTHDQVEAMTLGDRVAVLRDGALQQVAEPQRLYNEPANLFVACFVGAPPMNTVVGRVEGGDGGPWFTAGRLRFRVSEAVAERLVGWGSVVWAIRPEHISLAATAANNYNEDAGLSLPARVTVVEPWGREQVVYCLCGGAELAVVCPVDVCVAPGAEVVLRPQWARQLWFAPGTGERIAAGLDERSE